MRASTACGATAVAVGVVAVLVAGSPHPPLTTSDARATVQPVTSATLVCPGPPSRASAGESTGVHAVSPTSGRGGPAERLAVSAGSGIHPAVLGATRQGGDVLRFRTVGAAASTGALVRATGALAPNAAAAQLTQSMEQSSGPAISGVAAAPCSPPRRVWWFVGADTEAGASSRLVLANPSPLPAQVDLRFFSVRGLVRAPGASGVVVAPRSRQVIDLARFAPGRSDLALQIVASRGSVTAAVAVVRQDGNIPAGMEFLPASVAPGASTLVAAGVAPDQAPSTRQRLVVLNAGPRQQLVRVSILDRDGAFTSSLLPSLQVGPHSVAAADLSGVVKDSPAAILLTAGGPVSGAVVSERAKGTADLAVSGAGTPLRGPAVVHVFGAVPPTLVFSTAQARPVSIPVEGLDAAGRRVGRQLVELTGRSTVMWQPPVDWRAAYLSVDAPPDRAVQASAVFAGAGGISVLPVSTGRRTLVRPAVIPF